jgi:ChrR Cupin-like domain
VEPGVSVRALHDNGITRTRMLALQPGATWQQARACEALVMQGVLRVANVAQTLPMESFVLSAGATTFSGGPLGALLYVRELYGDPNHLPAAERAWWPTPGAAPVVVAADVQGWVPFGPGVEIKPLHGSDAAISIFARFAPGASVAAHGHGLDEDCIMLRGDLYLSDTLLREGEYQLAPVGTGHQGLASDGGAVLFFHGAIDSNLRGG